MFRGRNLLIVTKHDKEKVIAPVLEKALGVNCILTDAYDTDELGTFSGERERKEDPITTARKKCLDGMAITHCDLAVASEGSFGPHPNAFFLPADDEFLIFIDKRNGLEIKARELSTETNFNGQEIKTEAELKIFAEKVKFPSHGLILKNQKDQFSDIVKGITNEEQLISTFRRFIALYGKVFAETDMRAMYNPTRMRVIEKAAIKLAQKINNLCPACSTPGFGITEAKPGLPCNTCHFPTRSTLSYLYTCQKCNHQKEEFFPGGKRSEDPMYCDVCNP